MNAKTFLERLFGRARGPVGFDGAHRINRHFRKKGPGRRHDYLSLPQKEIGGRLRRIERPAGTKVARMAAQSRLGLWVRR